MAPQRNPRRAGKLLAAAFLIFVFLATLLCAASWSVRSEARGAEKSGRRAGYAYSFGREDRELSYALIGRETNVQTATGAQWDDFDRLRDEYDQDLLWVSIRGQRFIVLDEGVVDEARRLVAPIDELGARQGRLGAQQAQIGGKQAAIGARQAAIGARQAALSTRLASLSMEGARESEQAAIEEALEELGRKMDALGRQMEPLAREQEELGTRQSELGRRMERLSERVHADMRRLVDDAIDAGKARPLRD
jgi:hypothetical protein